LISSAQTAARIKAYLSARGYWAATSGNVTDEVWVEYIKNQTPPEPDDNFNVT
jgi:putative transposase